MATKKENPSPKTFLEKTEIIFRILGIIIAGSWIASTYFYEKMIEPKNQPSFLNISHEIEKVDELKDIKVYRIRVTFQNKSKVREKLIASWYHVVGQIYDYNINTDDTAWVNSNSKALLEGYSSFRRYNIIDSSSNIGTGQLFDPIWLNPEQEIETQFLAFIPDIFESIECLFYGTTVKSDERVDVRWVIDQTLGDNIPEYGINTGNGTEPNWEILDDKQHSSYIKKFDMVYTRKTIEIYTKKK